MDTAQWPQDIGMMKQLTNMEEMVSNTTTTCSSRLPTSSSSSAAAAASSMLLEQQRKARPQKEQALNCPRCNSTNTKFCYYNNYSLTQPRYFCKTCRRYWTEGGSLRNVPVGGGSRKNKRSSSSSSLSPSQQQSSSASKKIVLRADLTITTQPQQPTSSTDQHHHHQNPKIIQGQDLNLAYPIRHDYQHISEFVELPTLENNHQNNNNDPSPPPTSTSSPLSALELLRTGMTSRGLSSFMPMPTPDTNTVYSSGFALQDFKQTLNFGLDGLGNGGYGTSLHNHHHRHQGNNNINGSRLSFPFEDLKHVSTTTTTTTNDHHHHQFEQNKGQAGHHDPNGYWNGMLGGGTW